MRSMTFRRLQAARSSGYGERLEAVEGMAALIFLCFSHRRRTAGVVGLGEVPPTAPYANDAIGTRNILVASRIFGRLGG
jgi:hypothetical protein